MNEIMVYASIEPISWGTGVSRPAEKKEDETVKEKKRIEKTKNIEAKLDAILGSYEKSKK